MLGIDLLDLLQIRQGERGRVPSIIISCELSRQPAGTTSTRRRYAGSLARSTA